MTVDSAATNDPSTIGWRFRLGVVIFVVGFASPLLIPLVAASGLPAKWKALISGALAVGIPEVFSIAAVAIMGKSGFSMLKERVFGFIKRHGPPERVGTTRYRIGLIMFFLPILFGWLQPYLEYLFPVIDENQLYLALAGDLVFATSLYLLGAEYWGKVKALFVQ